MYGMWVVGIRFGSCRFGWWRVWQREGSAGPGSSVGSSGPKGARRCEHWERTARSGAGYRSAGYAGDREGSGSVRLGDAERQPARGAKDGSPSAGEEHAAALARLPGGLFVLTSAYDGERAGARVLSVQVCATEPLLICVASKKGHRIEPLIRDSHAFAVCLVAPTEKLILRKFPEDSPGEEGVDPFDAMPVGILSTGSPVIERATAVFDCEVVRHFDMEADHELYIGQVLASRVRAESAGDGSAGGADASVA